MAMGKTISLGAGGLEQNVYSGEVVISTTAQTFNVTIPSVDTTKCAVIVKTYLNSTAAGSTTDEDDLEFTGRLTSPTNLELTRDGAKSDVNIIVFWQVIEFVNAKSVQYGRTVKET